MGRRGPAPVPTYMLKLRNSKRLYLRRDEVAPQSPLPPCPDWLCPYAQKVYARFVEANIWRLTFADLDAAVVARYADACARWADMAQFLDRHGTTYPIRRRGRVTGFASFPQFQQYLTLDRLLRQLEHELGLTPHAYMRLADPPDLMDRAKEVSRWMRTG